MSKIIITGATGNAGSAVLSAAIASLNIAHITVLARRPPYEISPKVESIQIPSDESEPRLVVERLKGHGPCIWAVGISQTQVKQKEYCRINHDCTLEAAKGFSALGNGSDPFRFVFMSAEGARKGEKGWSAYSRVKGKTERELAAMAFKTFAPVSVRPAGTNPTQEYANVLALGSRAEDAALKVVYPPMVVDASHLGKVCVGFAGGLRGRVGIVWTRSVS